MRGVNDLTLRIQGFLWSILAVREMVPGSKRWISRHCPEITFLHCRSIIRKSLSVWIFCPQLCPPGSVDFRRLQCETFNGKKFMGQNYLWEPFVDGKLSKVLPRVIHTKKYSDLCIFRMQLFYSHKQFLVMNLVSGRWLNARMRFNSINHQSNHCYPRTRIICLSVVGSSQIGLHKFIAIFV